MNESLAEIEDSYPLSPLQTGMLIHTLGDSGHGMYVNQTVYHFEHVDSAALLDAWDLAVARHSILRTAFQWEGVSEPRQTVYRRARLEVRRADWRGLSEWEQEARLRAALREEVQRGFDLTRPPLLRLGLFQVGPSAYYLVATHHHLLLDGWSHPLLIAEVRAIYHALRRRESPDLPAPRPFRDYVDWLARQDVDRAEQFWRSYLAGFDTPTALPGDRGVARDWDSDPGFDEWRMRLSPAALVTLRAAASACRCTLNTLFVGAWALVLSRYSGQQDVVFGMLVSGRPPALEGVESMIGMFLNTLPVRVRVRPELTVWQWLAALQSAQTDLLEFEYSPLATLQRWSEVALGTPLFESMIDTNNTPGQRREGEGFGAGASRVQPSSIRQNLPLVLYFQPVADDLLVTLSYDTRRFAADSMAVLGGQLQTLLLAMAQDPSAVLAEVPMMSAGEVECVLGEWNRTDTVYPADTCLHQLFESQVTRTPQAPAIAQGPVRVAYRDLDRQANGLARSLGVAGVRPGMRVALCAERSIDMVVGLLAILKAGAAYVPLDPAYPTDRLRFMLQDSAAQLLLAQSAFIGQFADIATPILSLDMIGPDTVETAFDDALVPSHPDHPAVILYTSGSTGLPKGVVLSHRATVNRIFVEPDPFAPDEALCVKTSLSFVDSIWELFSAWRNGLCATLVPTRDVQDPARLLAILAQSGATRIVLVPSLLRALLDLGTDLAVRLPRLRHWISSGEPLPADLCQRFGQTLPAAILTNLYGTTETWDALRCDSRQYPLDRALPIGRPMGNMQAYVLDERLCPAPIGVAGELYIAGVSLAHGYWRRPALTAEKFLPNSFASRPGARMYRTGDLARWRPDGSLEYLGRRDGQLKLRGFRIEIEEIESVLRCHPGVLQAAVILADDQRLASFVVPREGEAPTQQELRRFCRERLPEQMVPVYYVALTRLPLTPSGKTDRRALPVLDAAARGSLRAVEPSPRAPLSPTEQLVAQVWCVLLGMDEIGSDSDFFDLGGHSLLAAISVSRLSQMLGRDLSLSALFDTRTLGAFGAWIDRTQARAAAAPELTRAQRGRTAPLSFAQQRMWFLDRMDPGSLSYTVSDVLRFGGRLDDDALCRALGTLVARHESLRTTFETRDGEPVQVINDPEKIALPLTDLTALPVAEREDVMLTGARQQARQPWDLQRGPLWRVGLFRLAEDDHALVLTMHHIITDGRSQVVFARDLQALYRDAYEGLVTESLPELPLQYADYALWQRERLQGKSLARLIEYWKGRLAQTPALDLPTDRPRPAVHRYRGAQAGFDLSEAVSDTLARLAERREATVFMVLLAGFQLLLSRYSGQYDICVGTPVANRPRPELENLIGLFVNTLAIRTDLSGDPTFEQLLLRVRTSCLGAYDHQGLPFDRVVDALQVERDLSRHPLFQVMLVHQLAAPPRPGLVRRQQAPEQATSNFDLVLVAQESTSGIQCTLRYNSDLFDAATITRMAGHLQCLYAEVAAHPDCSLSRLSMLTASERELILQVFARSADPVPAPQPIHERVAEWAGITPTAIAVQFGADTLTYAELDERAARLARQLVALGVGPETLVGWCFERCPEMIVALLGILKAGGAFVPLDPGYPAERLAFMIEDTQLRLVISTERLRHLFAPERVQVIPLDQNYFDGPRAAPGAGAHLAAPVHGSDLAYVIYTSGSTGTPKGVMVEHRNLAAVIGAQIPQFDIKPGDRVLQTLALSFDAAMGEIFRSLAGGATLCLADRADLMPGPGLLALLRAQHINTLTLATAALTALTEFGTDLPDLATLTVGGEACPAELARRWRSGRRMLNGYGPTETTIGATLAVDWPLDRKPPLGRPLAGVTAYVLDRWLQPVPIGVPGELYLGGAGVSRGYLNRPALTAAAFVPDPFGTVPGARLYRTGDLVNWLPDGALDFLGRIDQQVKIRGFRIELSEVESSLRQHPLVTQCAVIAVEQEGVKRLAAYAAVPPGHEDVAAQLRDFLKTRLPDYMVPAFFIPLPELPLTPNGKIDRKALPLPRPGATTNAIPMTYPRNPTEEILAGIWQDLLGLEQVSIHANFFELGGDSIMSIQVVARATAAGLDLNPKEVFQHQTIAELAEAAGSIHTDAVDQAPVSAGVSQTGGAQQPS